MAKFSYKKSTTTNLKATGVIDLAHHSIQTDDEGELYLKSLFAPFDGSEVTLSISLKSEEELPTPEDVVDDEE